MQCQLLRDEFWTADVQQDLRTKIEQSNTHYGPAAVAVFHGLTQGNRAEGSVRALSRPNFHTGPDPSNPGITLAFQTITTAPARQNMSQEVCACIPNVSSGSFMNKKPLLGTPPGTLSTES